MTIDAHAVPETLSARAALHFSAYRDGDPQAMGALVAAVSPILWHTARAARLDSATAEDVVQTTWLALLRHAESISSPAAVLQWLVVTARREAWRISRAQTRTRPQEDTGIDVAAPVHESPESLMLQGIGDDVLWKHLATLPERCQQLLRVIAFADKPDYSQLAVSLGMPVGSIGPTRGRCIAKLRAKLAADTEWEYA